ncbi:MAG: sugar phosphate isomerase/epimerase [Flavobacteriaceae bacterium]|nr:sugar phosphate isomerase/epimerase [Flavobacteriaceae bacterium]
MKYGINMLLWATDLNESHYPLIENIKNWGYDAIEFPIFNYDLSHFKKIGSKLDDLELERTTVAINTPESNPISLDPAIRKTAIENLKRSVDVAYASGSKILCGPLHSAIGLASATGPTSDELKYCSEVLTQVADHAKEADITLALEYLNRFECYILTCATDLVSFVKEVNHPNLKLMYDTFHANIEEKNIEQAIRESAELCVHFHIAENDRSTPGQGGVDWKTTFKTLKDVNYDGMMTIEAFGQAIPDMVSSMHIWRKMYPNEEYLAKKGLEFMKNSWENL